MKIRITKANPQRPSWVDHHVGETFDVMAFHPGIPSQYEVSLSELFEKGKSPVKIGFVPESQAAEVWED